jgi:hypothetical protein
MKNTPMAWLALILLVPMAAPAQVVWRCGPEGRIYSDAPCANGRTLDVATDTRPTADVRAAQVQAARDIRLADALRRERLAQEAVQRGSGLGSLGPQAAQLSAVKPGRALSKADAKPRRKHQPEAPGTWRAVAPASRRTKG